MNKAEQSYAASEVEMLAVVRATKYFRCFLYGKKFVVRTDHSALTYSRNYTENNSRLLLWGLKLSELDFIVENTPCRCLSRHVGAVIH